MATDGPKPMFVVKDSEAFSNPWLTYFYGQFLWGPDRDNAYRFSDREKALQTGKAAMPSLSMSKRVVVEPA
ncbi:hypothetical protein HQ571_00785 [Candidatus Kuenenbacteria bacterium]|nr:hypothetical protein [Candidatus Kuenenbacteria bacterium]